MAKTDHDKEADRYAAKERKKRERQRDEKWEVVSAVLNIFIFGGLAAITMGFGISYWFAGRHALATYNITASLISILLAAMVYVLPYAYKWDREVSRPEIAPRPAQVIEERASISLVALAIDPPTPTVGKPLEVRATLKNTARTQARNVRGYIAFEGVIKGQSPNFDYTGLDKVELAIMPPEAHHVARFMISRSVSTQQVQPVSEAMLSGMTSGQNVLYAHGRLDYEDVQGTTHWVEWCYYLTPDFQSWAPCNSHNSSDSD
jgi:hypothetical protein